MDANTSKKNNEDGTEMSSSPIAGFISVVEVVEFRKKGGAEIPIFGRRTINIEKILDMFDDEDTATDAAGNEFDMCWVRYDNVESGNIRVQGSIDLLNKAIREVGGAIVQTDAEVESTITV